MKKVIVILILFISCFATKVDAQVYSPQLQGHFGIRIIYYPYGYYQGNVTNGVANGLGTFYFKDGSFFQGNFSNGWWHGEGVIVTPYNGYLTGCWAMGNYIGNCPNNNSYNNDNRIETIISDVQDERPDDNRYTAVSPEGYKITRIEPGTKMGRTLLGNYSGK